MAIPPIHVMNIVERFIAFAYKKLASENMCFVEQTRPIGMGRNVRYEKVYSVVYEEEYADKTIGAAVKLTERDVQGNRNAFVELSRYMYDTYVDAQDEYRDDATR